MTAALAQRVTYRPRGDAIRLLESQDGEVLLEGPVGTGKSYALVWKAHLICLAVPGVKALFARKTLTALTASAVETYKKVLATARYGVKFFGGSQQDPPAFRYPNGSRIMLGGLTDPGRIMSQEYDIAFVFEATELTLNEWESIITRLRNGVLGYQQLAADCNPNLPTHWLNQRASAGLVRRLLSRHKDNPALWDAVLQTWTAFGRQYMARLQKLTGVRRKRLLDGVWAAAEGQIYEAWDPAIHLVDAVQSTWRRGDVEEPLDSSYNVRLRRAFPGGLPASWPRIWTIDFGYTNPFVWQWWALDPDDRLWLYREIYMTRRLVEDHVAQGLALSADDPRPSAIVTDHDAEDRATFERKSRYRTVGATKNVSAGIQAVAERLQVQPDGRPRLFILRDALVERDPALAEAGLPTCTADEYAGYVWNTAAGRRRGDEPVKECDHGMDATRYTVAFRDLRRGGGLLAS